MSPTPQEQIQDDEIDLAELWRAIWAGKFIIIIITSVFAVASVFYALSKPDQYKASVLLAPVSSDSGSGGLAALAGQFGGLASLAGVNLGGGGNDKTSLAIATLKSRSFIENFIEKHNLLVPLMAVKEWDKQSNKFVYNNEIYNDKTEEWLMKSEGISFKPTNWQAYQYFLKKLIINEDKTTSLITIDIEFYSPIKAKEWLTLLVNDINEHIRGEEKSETQASIQYLKEQINNIKVSNMETVFYQLIEEQTKNMMLAQVKKEYVFKTIDPAQVPDKKSNPKRVLIVLLGIFLGGILSVLIVLVRYFITNQIAYETKL